MTTPQRPRPSLTPAEEAQLRRLVDQAYDLRSSGYIGDACQAIEDWFWRALPDRLERS